MSGPLHAETVVASPNAGLTHAIPDPPHANSGAMSGKWVVASTKAVAGSASAGPLHAIPGPLHTNPGPPHAILRLACSKRGPTWANEGPLPAKGVALHANQAATRAVEGPFSSSSRALRAKTVALWAETAPTDPTTGPEGSISRPYGLPEDATITIDGATLGYTEILTRLDQSREELAMRARIERAHAESTAVALEARLFARQVRQAITRRSDDEAFAEFEAEERLSRRVLAAAKGAATRELRGIHLRRRTVPPRRAPWVH